jgi:hypothetical protein
MPTTHLGLPYVVSGQSQPETPIDQSLDLIDAMPASTVVSGAFATRPAAGWNGRLFLPTDGYSLQRDSGSAFARFGPLFPLTDPTIPAFAFTNQGGATMSTTNGAVLLTAPSSSTDQLRILDVALPTPPYTVTAGLLPTVLFANFLAAGMCLRDSSGGGVITFDVVARTAFLGSGLSMAVSKWTSPSAFSAEFVLIASPQPASPYMASGLLWLQIHDDNTNWTFNASNDGVNFVTLFSVARNTFITPTRIGIYANSNGGGTVTAPVYLNMLHWRAS